MLVVDDHPVYREGIIGVIRRHPELEVVGEAADGRSALACVRELDPDVMVLDLGLPDIDGVEVIDALAREGLRTRAVIVSALEDSATVYRAVAAGARAYLPKICSGDMLCDALRAVARGQTMLPPDVQDGLAHEIRARRDRVEEPLLSKRELEVLRHAAEGLSTAQIAETLIVSVPTVKTHLQHAYAKLEVSDRAAAVALAIRRGLLS